MEARIARLEATVGHIQSDVSEIKTDVRRLGDKIDDANRSLNDKIDDVNRSLGCKIDSVKDSLASAKVWALLLYIAQTATLFGVMAHGFGWLK